MTVIRRALPKDKPTILRFTERTFNWGDYIPEVIDDWINGDGELLVAEDDGRVVGIVHLATPKPGEGWLEGIRIDPEYRRHGLGRLLSLGAMEKASQAGLSVVRLAINQTNTASQALAEALGFGRILCYRELSAGAAHVIPAVPVRVAEMSDVPFLIKLVRESSSSGLGFVDWTCFTLDEESLAEQVRAQRILVSGESCGFAAQIYEGRVEAGNLCGSASGVRSVLDRARQMAAQAGLDKAYALCVAGSPEEEIARDSGFSDEYTSGDESGLEAIWEKRI